VSGETILVVEDNADVLLTVRLSLETAGYSVIGASSAEEALEGLASVSPDLVLLDLTLPHMTGWELLQKIRSEDGIATTPVVMLTGHVGDDVAKRASELGASGVLAKPFEVGELHRIVRRALAGEGAG
jgi:CheY-like chemotaxis protein